MRIAWLTPFTKKSAIGRFSQAVTRELARKIQVDLWLADREDPLDTLLPIVEYDPRQPLDKLWPRGAYDFAICQLGNYVAYHREIFEFSRKVPSIIVLHDYVMHHFFAGLADSVLGDMESHCRLVEQRYGGSAAEANARPAPVRRRGFGIPIALPISRCLRTAFPAHSARWSIPITCERR